MKNPNEVQGQQEQPEIKEQTFGGALFGFKRSAVLEYVRNLSDENEKYVRTLGESIDRLQHSLQVSQEESERLRQQITQLNNALDTSNNHAAASQEQANSIRVQLAQCQEQLQLREEGCARLQQEQEALKKENDEISVEIAQAKLLVTQSEERLAAETARHTAREDELKKLYLQKLKETQDSAQEEKLKLNQQATRREQLLQQENEEKLKTLNADAEFFLQRLEEKTDAQQARLVRSVEKVDADLVQIRQEMELLHGQLSDARGRIQQTTRQLDDLLDRMPEQSGLDSTHAKGRVSIDDDGELAGNNPPKQDPHKEKAYRMDSEQIHRSQGPDFGNPEKANRAQSAQSSPKFTTVRSTRTSVTDHLLDALGRLWEKK